MAAEAYQSKLVKMMGTKTITVLVGGGKECYTVHQKLLFAVGLVFDQLPEIDGSIMLPDVKTEVFETFLEWLYGSDLQRLRKEEVSIHSLVDLYNFADDYDCFRFRDAIMDAFRDNLAENDRLLSFKDMKRIFSEVKIDMLEGLLKFCVAVSMWEYFVGGENNGLQRFFEIPGFAMFYLDVQATFLGKTISDPRARGQGKLEGCYFHICRNSDQSTFERSIPATCDTTSTCPSICSGTQ